MKWPYRQFFLFGVLFCFLCFQASAQIPSFQMPDTVCVNSPVNIVNTSAGGTSFYWNFCVADLNQTSPQATNLGNIGGLLSLPVFIDLVSDNGNYYGFVVNHSPGALLRLDFGNSFLNTPVVTNLGNFGGILPSVGNEGVQVVKNNGRWYAIIVGGGPESSTIPHIVRVDIGPVITNPSPVGTDWGNPPGANLSQPIDLYLFTDNSSVNNWYGFTVNADNNTVTLFNFGTDLANPPTASNLGNVGNYFIYPDGIYALNDAGNWHVFVANGLGSTITRLDFGNSLLNIPTAVNLGNPGGLLTQPRDITIMKFCDQAVGFVVNADNDLVRLDFHNDVLSTPTGTLLGNIGNFDFSHSISKLFRVDADLYCFIPNVDNNTLTRLKFTGCTNSNIPNFASKDPPAISYSSPGTYHVNLMMDEGLATESSFCKTITAVSLSPFFLGNDTVLCEGDSIKLMHTGTNLTYAWQDGSSADSLTVLNSGKYKLIVSDAYGCSVADSVVVGFTSLPSVSTLPDTSLCAGNSVLLKTNLSNSDSARWSPAAGLSDPLIGSPRATPSVSTRYFITAFHQSCPIRDSILVTVLDTPSLNISPDTLICTGGMAQLFVTGADHYAWSPATGLSDPTAGSLTASPVSSQKYHVTATAIDGCASIDSVLVGIKAPDLFGIDPAKTKLCRGDSIQLKVNGANLSLGDSYDWISPIGSQDTLLPTIVVSPAASSIYQVVGYDKICNLHDTLNATVAVVPSPDVTTSKSNDIDCVQGQAILTATGGIGYAWSPAQGLSNPFIASPVATPFTSTVYYVRVTDVNGCTSLDSIDISVTKGAGSVGYPVAGAFTPNGDGVNDCFSIKYWGLVDNFEMSVFNRWGVRVFYSQNPAQCWDGTYNGQKQPAGTFVYMIKARTLCGDVFRKGTVLLVR